MSEALFSLLLALCTAAPSPCFAKDNVIQIPVYANPHVDADDLQTFEWEGVIVKPVAYQPEI
jgi:hypothetical protein